MATSMNISEDDSSSDESTDKLNVASPVFDPYKALYAKSLNLPVPDAKQFNNLAEFENFLKGKDAASQKKSKPPKKVLPGIIAQRAAAQAKEAVRKAAILQKNKGPAERSETQQRKMRQTNVFTKMQNYEKGPLSLLLRSVNEKLKVLVVVRAAVAVRSHCKGYVVAFDKHMNMALVDVDETFIRPLVKKDDAKHDANKSIKKERAHKQKAEASSSSVTVKSQRHCDDSSLSSTTLVATGSQRVQTSLSSVQGSANTKGADKDMLGRSVGKQCTTSAASNVSNNQNTLRCETATSSTDSSKPGSSASTSDNAGKSEWMASFSVPSFRIPKKSRQTTASTSQKSDQTEAKTLEKKLSENPPDTARKEVKSKLSETHGKCLSDSELVNVRRDKDQETCSDVEKSRVKTVNPTKSSAPFWPTYKAWAEERCYCKYDIVERHVNQLFIRGDNVVSVSLVS